MTDVRKHLAARWYSQNGPRLECRCGDWISDETQTVRQQQLAHRAHRVEMGELVRPLKPTSAERLAAAEAAIERVRETAERVRRFPTPENTGPMYADLITCALDGDMPKETTT